ncbi:Heat shock protein 30 [Triplophysa tibetana]|uniref:Heat shock protein 30 n=1 Tax=Triplophysa tibetana TaxID=1572043 RepID=A0A5A9N139_9TELE|nr:Heat shock protein 30 [Triplophysa tibetana]
MVLLCGGNAIHILESIHEDSLAVCSLCPEITSLYRHTDVLQELMRSLEQLGKLQHKISEDIQQISESEEIQPVAYTVEKEGRDFVLTLDTEDFSPEELSVKQVGRRLQVSGKTEKKQEDGEGCYSYRIQEFRRVFDLPEGVNPETVSCFITEMKTINCSGNTTQLETENNQNNINETHKTDQSSETISRRSTNTVIT